MPTSTLDKEIVLQIEVQAGQALKTVQETQKAIDGLKKAIQQNKEDWKNGKKSEEEYYKELARLTTELNDNKNTLRANQKVLDEQVKAYKKNEGSINSMRAQLKILRAQYEDLSKAERDSAKGQDLLKKIQSETAAIKQLEADQGDFRRNVGNYQSVWDAEVEKIQSVGGVLAQVFGNSGVIGTVMSATKTISGFLRDVSTESQNTQTQMSAMNKTITDTANETQKASNVVENAGQSFTNLGNEVENATKPVAGFGAAERAAVDEAKNMASATSDVATATSQVAESAAAAATSETAAATAVGGLGGAFNAAKTAVSAFSKQLLALLANPIVLTIAAIAAVVMKLVSAFKQNDQAMTALKQAFSAFQPILNAVNNLFSKLVDYATKAITVLGKAAKAIAGFFGGESYKKAQAQAEALVVAQDQLQDKEREYTLAHADNEAKIAELREIASDAENHTIEERKKALEEAEKIERADLNEKRAITEEKVRLAEQEALQVRGWTEMTAEAWAALTDEEKDNITQLRAALRETDKEMSDFERKMNKQMNSLNKSATSSSGAAATAKKERIKNEQEALQELESMYIATIKDMYAKEEAVLRSENEKKINQIKLKLQTEKNLTTKAREALNKQILLLEAKLQTDIYDLREKYSKEKLKNQLEETKTWYETLLQGVRGEARETVEIELVKINTKATIQSLNEVLENFKKVRDEVVKDSKSLSEEEIKIKYGVEMDQKGIDTTKGYLNAMSALISSYDNEYLEKEAKTSNLILEVKKQEQNNITKITKEGQLKREEIAQQYADVMAQISTTEELDKYYYNEVEKTRILEQEAQRRLEIAKNQYDTLANYTDEEKRALYETDEEYQLAVAHAQLNVTESQTALAEAVRNTTAAIQAQKEKSIETYTAIAESVSSVIGSVQSIFDTLAESDEKYKKYSTALAMMQILVSTAISIANAIQGATAAAAQTGVAAPFTTPVFIAEMVAIVAGAIASATATLKKAQSTAPAKPKFAHGGLVGNQVTTRTDDTVDAKLSVGEYIISAPRVKELGLSFLDSLNGTKTKRKDLPLKFSTGGSVPSMTTIQKVDAQFDYQEMKDIFKEAVAEVQPVVSVKEINEMQTRVEVKENIATY